MVTPVSDPENTNSLNFRKLTPAQRRAVVEGFRDALKIGVPDEMRIVHAHSPEAYGPGSKFRVYPLNDAAIERLDEDENLYYCVAAVKPQTYADTGNIGWRRTQEGIGAGVVVGFDDIGTKTVKKCGEGLAFFKKTLAPTAVIETSPDNFQVLYFLDAPILDTHVYGDVLRSIIKPLSDKYGIDKLADINRVLRLPFGINNKTREDGSLKYPDADGKPWRVRLVHADYDARYSPEEIAAAYGLTIVPTLRKAQIEKRVASRDEDPFKAAGFDLIAKAFSSDRTTKEVRTESGRKYRIRCPFEDEHASGGKNDDAFIADPAASKNGYFTFACSHASCNRDSEAYAEGRRTFAAAMTAAGVALDACAIAEQMERKELDEIERELSRADLVPLSEVTWTDWLSIVEAEATKYQAAAIERADDVEPLAAKSDGCPDTSITESKKSAANEREERQIDAREQKRQQEAGERAKRLAILSEKKNLVERAKALEGAQMFSFADKIPNGMTKAEAASIKSRGGPVQMAPVSNETNLYRFFDALYVGGSINEVHYDTSRRMLVDERGETVNDEWPVRELMDAARAVLFKNLTSDTVSKALRKWALDYKFNDISERVKERLAGVVWDQTERLENFLIDTFRCADTPDNRLFSKYWCLSLYNRVMSPGCRAPISMALFGPQDAGKSYFQKVICEELLFNRDAAPVEFDPDRQFRDLFRDIYGISIIASIPEMTNFGKIGVNRMKAFQTGTTDTFDQKFGFSGAWPRQFIIVMDGNRYEGLWRDNDDVDTHGESQGERRWYPIFAFEIPDSVGSVRWRADQGLKLPWLENGAVELRETLWQLMKECESFMRQFGDEGYHQAVNDATLMVKRFSKREKDRDEGTVRDKTFDEQFPSALYRAIARGGSIATMAVDGVKVRGLRVLAKDIQTAYFEATKQSITVQKVSKKMKALQCSKGFAGRDALKVTAFVFNQPAFAEMRDGHEDRQKFTETFARLFASDAAIFDDDGCDDKPGQF